MRAPGAVPVQVSPRAVGHGFQPPRSGVSCARRADGCAARDLSRARGRVGRRPRAGPTDGLEPGGLEQVLPLGRPAAFRGSSRRSALPAGCCRGWGRPRRAPPPRGTRRSLDRVAAAPALEPDLEDGDDLRPGQAGDVGSLLQRLPDHAAARRAGGRDWCGWGDLNSHALRRSILSALRLPFRHTRDRHLLSAPPSRGKSWREPRWGPRGAGSPTGVPGTFRGPSVCRNPVPESDADHVRRSPSTVGPACLMLVRAGAFSIGPWRNRSSA